MITDKRIQYKPFEYPKVLEFVDKIHSNFWVHKEIVFNSDIHDFHTYLNDTQKEVVRRSLLAISQVEVNVKLFWGKLYDMFPKPEFNLLGATFAENEGRHSEAYSRLLTELGLEEDFERVLKEPIFKEREAMCNAINQKHTHITKLLLFTLIIENASLFSQFANILSFQRFAGQMKNVANIIAWTAIEEQIHAEAGIYLIQELLKEGYTLDYEELKQFIEVEMKLIDWIYKEGELDFFTKKDMKEYIQKRVDDAIYKIEQKKIYNVENYRMKWFEEEIFADKLDDFFARRPVDYTKHTQSITEFDLF